MKLKIEAHEAEAWQFNPLGPSELMPKSIRDLFVAYNPIRATDYSIEYDQICVFVDGMDAKYPGKQIRSCLTIEIRGKNGNQIAREHDWLVHHADGSLHVYSDFCVRAITGQQPTEG